METDLIIAGINAAVALLQMQMQLAAAHAATKQGRERDDLIAEMEAAWMQAMAANEKLAETLRRKS